MDDICKELGMSKKTLYTYYGQKDDLVEAALAASRSHVQEKIDVLLGEKKTVWEHILTFSQVVAQAPDVRKIPPLVYDLNKYYPGLAKKHNILVYEQNVNATEILMQKGVEEGLFRSDLNVSLAAHLLAKMHSSAIEDPIHCDTDATVPVANIIDFTMDIFVRGILSEDGMRRYLQMLEDLKCRR